MKSLRMPVDGDTDGFDVTGDARDQDRALDLVVIHLDDPAIGEIFRGFGDFPTEQRAYFISTFLLGERLEKRGREEMDVRVGDCDFTPGSGHHNWLKSRVACAISSLSAPSTWTTRAACSRASSGFPASTASRIPGRVF